MFKLNRNLLAAAIAGVISTGAFVAAAPALAQQGASAPASPSDKVNANDWAWMEKAARAGAAEIQAAQVAAGKATNPKIREYAQKVVDDHTRALDELKGIASSRGINLPTEPLAAKKREIERLKKLTAGSRFDEEYLARPGVIDHTDAVKLFKQGTTNVRDAEIKAYAQKTLPTVEEHLKMAKTLAG